MVQIQESKSTGEIVHMYWVTALPPGGDRSFNACLVLADRYRKTPMFLKFHKDDTAMDKAIMIGNKFISHTGLFKYIIMIEIPNSNKPYGQTSITCFSQSCCSQQHITLKRMDYQRE
ncbi:hypothetical protein O181_110326 [Austropuccinia psidii MF-1]|uniref:Uncharacterized protein n=1 Tax=Austropuccinia psidii MF-1 TaxID=1389203 RepID=A0A9Q3JYZ3_9BASI|nr:hypothetical protein [Austropuccinia psidii MF-1]